MNEARGGLDAAVSLLLAGGYLGVGDAVRLSRCDTALRAYIAADALFWRVASRAAEWKTPSRSFVDYSHRRGPRRCCRECGAPRATPMAATTGSVVFACLPCRQSRGGYSEVVTRIQIKMAIERLARQGWVPKYASVLRRLRCCKRSSTGAFLYWRAHAEVVMGSWPDD